MNRFDLLQKLFLRENENESAEQIIAELRFGAYLSQAENGRYDAYIDAAASLLEKVPFITPEIVRQAEALLLPLEEEAKSYRVHLVAHAHIDMNWMWGYQETAASTVDTFRTMLDLMARYPDFRFSQSQASTYRIIEENLPEMLEEIKARVKEGRWEVTASTWVENDENMPCGEALIRQQLLAKRYLSELFGLSQSDFSLLFQPDTFGHNAAIPDLCAADGVKYFYHCRGNDGAEMIYRWLGKGGGELLCYCDPDWYTGDISSHSFDRVPEVCAKYGIRSYLSVYGVGDHGGGPSACDIRKILKMREWRIFPSLVFSRYTDFFAEIDKEREKFPVRDGECNFIFTGCYSSHAAIKKQNRMGENAMRESEFLSSVAAARVGAPYGAESYRAAWKKLLFNQFHDILPGSGVKATTEYASAGFQDAMAAVRCRSGLALRSIAEQIDLSSCGITGEWESAAGVGSGVDMEHIVLSQPGQPGGKRRAFHLFNLTNSDYEGAYRLTVWNREVKNPTFFDLHGRVIESCQSGGKNGDWCGESEDFLLYVHIPALGYTTVILDEGEAKGLPAIGHYGNRAGEFAEPFPTLENDLLKVTFERKSMTVISFTDLQTGASLLAGGAGYFRFAKENAACGMTSWKEGEILSAENLNESCTVVLRSIEKNALRQAMRYTISFGSGSSLEVTVALLRGDPVLHYTVDVDFRENGDRFFTPRLDFQLPLSYTPLTYRYEIPFGVIDRPGLGHDVPSLSYAAAVREGEAGIALLSSAGYGFRGDNHALALTLLRASHDPDLLPEYGIQTLCFGVAVAKRMDGEGLSILAERYAHLPISCPSRIGKITDFTKMLPGEGSFAEVKNAFLTVLKRSEDGDGYILRLCSYNSEPTDFTVRFVVPVREAMLVNPSERKPESPLGSLSVSDGIISGRIMANTPLSIKVLI